MVDFLTIATLSTLAAISPGPDFAVVVKNSFYSRKAGLLTSLGVSCSILLHTSYCIMGLTLIISKSILLFNVIKYMGAAYLIYIGIKGLFSKNPREQKNKNNIHNSSLSNSRAFRQGFLCNALNPKAVMFFLALFTAIIAPATPLLTKITYGAIIAFIHLFWFSGLSIILTHHKMTTFFRKAQIIVTRIMGGFLILFGLRIATMTHPS